MAIKVSAIGFAPIKSTKFNWVESTDIIERGIRYDREWLVVEGSMFVAQRHGSLPVPLPNVVTSALGKLGLGIEVKTMCQVSARLESGNLVVTAPNMPLLSIPLNASRPPNEFVQVWRDSELAALSEGVEAEEWFTKFLSRERKGKYRLVRMASSCQRRSKGGSAIQAFHDGFPFMMIGNASLDSLSQRLVEQGCSHVPMNRFRPNVVLSTTEPHEEDHFASMRIGPVVFRGGKLCDRCVITCTDQDTAERGREPLRTLAQYRRGRDIGFDSETDNKVYFGRNFDHLNQGEIKVGDLVEVLRRD